ncbi:Gamma-glutamylputrescine oxidoreductase [Defluviimonas aquaemixtae]|uniref:Gamma-glutamylputrescine oxidoreductase n=1 Tax=Albidovulum aquaemixtae TaxID=1542388 RepID=A0A2R8B687_9RHOB|nr:FAD-binding oxidoreductase [Defluviimonas aquaemixtae]SPH18148.1 Gamma-glutamylputrescine oxidoreductase [Defluviimonas aquaemixtae]
MIRWTGEAEPGTPYWWDGAEWPDLTAPPPDRVDLFVIGAGYTGLSAAIAAHDAGARVAVVDAGQPGHGASTRNGGMMGAHPRLGWGALRDRFGAETADALFAEAAPALGFVLDLIAREGIDCDLERTGRIQLAWTRRHFEAQKVTAAHVRDKGQVACEVVERDALPREITTELYHGGILFPDHCAMHPWKYHAGMLGAVLRRGVTVSSHCAAVSIERVGEAFRVETKHRAVRADKVLLATNGYTPSAFRWFARRVFPIPSFLIATEELPADLLARLAPGRRMMVETRARHSYFRISPDGGRILFGGRASMNEIDLTAAAARLVDTMRAIWPEMRSVRLSHAWTGSTGFSFTHVPAIGVHEGIHYAMGFSGSGTVMAPYLGAKAAWAALGDARGETAYSRTGLEARWFHRGGAPHFLKAADLWYRHWVDLAENLAARRL